MKAETQQQSAPARRYWRSLDELARTREFVDFVHREFPEGASNWLGGVDRRHFLKLMGASMALAGLTACTRQPVERIVPYVKQPEELTPGKPLFFATAMTLGGYASGLLVESHEGHPTKIEGNPEHPINRGASNVFQQASLLDLYDPDRSQAVLYNGEITSWERCVSVLHDALQSQEARHGAGLRILTETVTSPTLHAQLQSVLQKFPEARWHQFEPLNRDNVHEGARQAFGQVVEPQYHFQKARVVLALDSDFMVSHPAALRYARDFIDGRRPREGGKEMNRFYAIESTPSVTGSNADHRLPLQSGEIGKFAHALAGQLGAAPGEAKIERPQEWTAWLSALADDLRQNRGRGIIIAGRAQPPIVHSLTHLMNQFLGNAGATIQYTESAEAQPVNQLQSLRELVADLKRGAVQVLVMLGGNPVYNAPADFEFAEHMRSARLSVQLSAELNEASALCQWHIPQNHYLESWSDARAYDGTVSIVQPLILPLYAGKTAHELLDIFQQPPGRSDYAIVREYWQRRKQWPDFEKGWRRALHDGLIAGMTLVPREVKVRAFDVPPWPGRAEQVEINFRPDPTLWDGRFANNGWLQELAKPITKLTWDNAALVSPGRARRESLANGDLVEIEYSGRKLRVPVWITPGQAEHSITVSLGYGRKRAGRVGTRTGFDAYVLRTSENPWSAQNITLWKVSGTYPLVTTQIHHNIDSEERELYREGTLAEYVSNQAFVKSTVEEPKESLFNPEEHLSQEYRWGMSIDLTACIGCNACVLACQSENNIPVVGKAEVANHREMQWIRVDSYFSGEPERPAVSFQPVPCMHCETAPCELVCPVAATVHDREGLNLQVYNRCIGTRYCSNNCPYKVRRFNFLQYADYRTPSLEPMRNPNVTLRWRGVMEKCTFCIQRISAARIEAKNGGRPIRDGEIRTACQQSCPTEAIIFGNLSDPNSRVSRLKALPLNFSMLGGLNTRPRTTYLAKLRNPNPALESRRSPHV